MLGIGGRTKSVAAEGLAQHRPAARFGQVGDRRCRRSGARPASAAGISSSQGRSTGRRSGRRRGSAVIRRSSTKPRASGRSSVSRQQVVQLQDLDAALAASSARSRSGPSAPRAPRSRRRTAARGSCRASAAGARGRAGRPSRSAACRPPSGHRSYASSALPFLRSRRTARRRAAGPVSVSERSPPRRRSQSGLMAPFQISQPVTIAPGAAPADMSRGRLRTPLIARADDQRHRWEQRELPWLGRRRRHHRGHRSPP